MNNETSFYLNTIDGKYFHSANFYLKMAQVAILKSVKANLDLKRKYPFKIIRVLSSCTTSSSGQINRLSTTN